MSNIDIQSVLAQMRAMASTAKNTGSTPASVNANGQAFSQLLKQSIDAVNSAQQEAGKLSAAFSAGAPSVDIAQVMIALQKANISFQAMTQVRNRLVDAYQEIMRMQI